MTTPKIKKSRGKLSRDQKSCLYHLGLGPDIDISGKMKQKERLAELLLNTLPVPPVVIDQLPDNLVEVFLDLRSVAGEPLGKLLANPKADLAHLQKIKDYAKEQGVDHPEDQEEYLIVYYAAIAGAMVYHQEKMSQYNWRELEKAFDSLCEKDWLPKAFRLLFAQSRNYCRSQP